CFGDQEPGNEEAGDHEEDVYADEAATRPAHEVVKDHKHNCNGAKALDIRPERGGGIPHRTTSTTLSGRSTVLYRQYINIAPPSKVAERFPALDEADLWVRLVSCRTHATTPAILPTWRMPLFPPRPGAQPRARTRGGAVAAWHKASSVALT